MSNRVPKKLRIRLLAGAICLALIAGISWTLFHPTESDAAWFDDNYAYRTKETIGNTGSSDSNKKVKLDVDTATLITAGKMQSDCDDTRFIDINGKVLQYYLDTAGGACNSASTDYYVLLNTINGSNDTIIYMYYGNPSASSGSQASQFAQSTFSPTSGPTAASEETGPGPIAYWKFDEGSGTTSNDSTKNSNTATFGASTAAPTWKSEDTCAIGKCLLFDGSNDVVQPVTTSLVSKSTYTLTAWFKTTGTSQEMIYSEGSSSSGTPMLQISVNRTTAGDISFENRGDGSTLMSARTTGSYNDGKWHQLAAVKLGSSSFALYVDGIQKATSTQTPGTTTVSQARIGANYQNGVVGTYFNGLIDEIKIYGYNRSAAQLQADFNARKTNEGVASSFGSSDPAQTLSNGLIGYWKMDESSWNGTTGEVVDSSGNALNGTRQGDATTTAGKFGSGGTFDGTGDYVSFSATPTFSDPSSVTITAWAKGSSGANTWGSNNAVFELTSSVITRLYSTGGQPKISVRQSDGNTGISTTQSSYTDNTWYHYSIVITPTEARWYINGSLYTTITPSAGTTFNVGSTPTFRIASTNSFNGEIDELRLYNRSLSTQEITALYDWGPTPVGYWNLDERTGTTANDTSGNGNTGTLTNGPTWNTGKYNGAVKFDGTNDQISAGDPSSGILDMGSNSFTVSAWVKLDSSYSSTTPTIVSKGGGSTSSPGYWMYWNGSVVRMTISNGDGVTTRPTVSSTTSINDGGWHYITGVFVRGGTSLLYIDGKLNNSSDWSAYSGSINTTSSLLIGDLGSSDEWKGLIDDVKIYNYALTGKQITRDMNGNHPAVGGSVGTAIGYWKFDEGQGTAANNSGSAGSAINGTLTNIASPATSTSGWTSSAIVNKALAFDGTNDYVTMGTNSSLNVIGADFTISSWVLTRQTGSSLFIMQKGDSPAIATGKGYGLCLCNSGTTWTFQVWDATQAHAISAASPTNQVSTNTWTHVTGVFNSTSKTGYLYVNGKLSATHQQTSFVAPDISANNFVIGGSGIGTSLWQGSIDETKVYNYALNADEVAKEYNLGKTEVLGSYSTASDGTTASNATERIYCIPGDTTSCSAPVGEWNFDERSGTSVNDTSGNNKTGTWNGTGSHWTAGKYNAAGIFNNSDDYVAVSSPSLPTGDFTYSLWAKVKTDSSNDDTLLESLNSTAGNELLLYITGGNTLQVTVNEAASIDVAYSSYLDKWTHIEVTRSGSALKVYLNGVLANSGTASGTLDFSTCSLIFGMDADSTTSNCTGSTGNFLNGSLDQIKIYNYARTQSQVAWDYNRGAPVGWWKLNECSGTTANDSTGNSYSGTITIGATGTYTTAGTCNSGTSSHAWNGGATGKFNSSLGFDGTDDYINLGTNVSTLQPTGNFSIASWFKTSVGTQKQIFSSYSQNTSVAGIIFGINPASGSCGSKIGLLSGKNTGSTVNADYIVACSSSTVADGSWHHGIATWDGTNVNIFVDGVLQTSTAWANAPVYAATNYIHIGNHQATGSSQLAYFSGQIDDVRIYNYALTSLQAKTLFNENSSIRYGPSSGTP